jgi:hypothetical protein
MEAGFEDTNAGKQAAVLITGNETMPFQIHGNRSYTKVSIARNAPAASGVYGLSNARQWLYVGASADIQNELLQLFQHPSSFLMQHSPSGFTYELSSAESRTERQNQLVSELGPIGNRKAADGPTG